MADRDAVRCGTEPHTCHLVVLDVLRNAIVCFAVALIRGMYVFQHSRLPLLTGITASWMDVGSLVSQEALFNVLE